MNEVTIEYMAGFFDGEGNVQISNDNRYPNSKKDVIRVSNNNKFILDCIKKTFGGTIYKKKIYTADGYNRQQCYNWQLNGRYGVELAKLLYTICIEKKENLGRFIERNEKNAERI